MSRITFSLAITSILFWVAPGSGIQAYADEQALPRLIGVDDLTATTYLSTPTYSPDGRWLAYVASTNDYDNNSTTDRVWLIPATGGDAIPMTTEFVSSWNPVFSKDGKSLYILSARGDDETQLWSLNLRVGGEALRLSNIERGVTSINFSPDERRLVLVLTDEATDESLVAGSNPWVVNRLQFKADSEGGYLDRRRDHIYVYDLDTESLTQITSGDYDDAEPAWSPDGRRVAFASNRSADPDTNANSDIWIVAASGDAGERPLQQVTTSPGEDTTPLWHPSGQSLAYISRKAGVLHNYAVRHLARIDLAGSKVSYLTDQLDRNIYSPRFSASGKSLYFIIEDSAEQHLAKMDWNSGKIKRVIDGVLRVSDFSFDQRGNAAAVISTDTHPDELYVVRRSEPKVLTQVNAQLMSQLTLGRTEEIHFKAPDGWDIEGLVTFPPDYQKGKRYPLILRIHGGPVSQYDHGFSFDSQLLAAQGYVVVRSNPRGSSGYGQDFVLGLYQGWGEKDYQDVLAAVDYAIAQGYGDPARLGLGGYSYGGILTNYILGHSTRFKAAVSGAGSGLYTASYGHDMYQHWYESEIGLPWENRELWDRLSPFTSIHKATTPTLFMGGQSDWNVPIQGAEQLYQVMKRVGVDTELVIYPGEHHGGWAFANQKDYSLRELAWYARYLQPDDAGAGEE